MAEVAQLLAHWQSRWHDILDAHPPTQDPSPRPALPLAMCEDFRLTFGFGGLPVQAGRACLAILPRGEALITQWQAALLVPSVQLSETAARVRMAELLARLNAVGAPPSGDGASLRVLRDVGVPLLDPVTDALDGSLFERADAEQGAAGVAALRLMAPVLRSSYASQAFADCCTWPLCAPAGVPNPYAVQLALERGGWYAGQDARGLVLWDRRDSHPQTPRPP